MLLSQYSEIFNFEAGCDEAGRGSLVGPVFAAAVILPKNFFHPLLNDSKKLSAKKRNFLREIIEKEAIAFSVASINEKEIDRINILQASIAAMHKALNQLNYAPDFILVDGNRFESFRMVPHQCIIGGDAQYASIAAASILAKTYRDHFMEQLHIKYPQYQWNKNKGYATPLHINAIRQFGLSPYHRKTFCSKFLQLTIQF